MSTIDDKATELEEAFRDLALREQASRSRSARSIPDGVCKYCGDEAMHGSLFCSIDCRDDYQHEQKAKRIAGIKR